MIEYPARAQLAVQWLHLPLVQQARYAAHQACAPAAARAGAAHHSHCYNHGLLPMSEPFIHAALRVRFCFTMSPHQELNPADVQRLRDAVSGPAKDWPANVLAAHVLQREMERRNERHVGRRRKARMV